MAQMLAPYNNSMRLGQGFNSYTQQICLDQAVFPGPPRTSNKPKGPVNLTHRSTIDSAQGDAPGVDTNTSNRLALEQGSNDSNLLSGADMQSQSTSQNPMLQVMPWVKPQIVTYSSRFVDKLSDVTDAMNISGSLSIKTATIGGKANGSYVDSDKFKSSDINFHLQVKVTNQIHDAQEYNEFNKIDKVETNQFPEVYGDCFISGWEEGGELNAIISMKVHDKAKVFEIKAGLEAEMNTPTISGKVTADFGMEKNNLSKSTETTISVTWSGGGSIKDPTEDWTIASLKKAAAAFPDFVAITPQRTYAILTKYTSLADFHEKKNDFSPLDYESAGIYTRALLDHYMDYKSMWKQISHATYELKGNRATIEMARPSEETYKLALIQPLPKDQANAKSTKQKVLEARSARIETTETTSEAQQQLVKAENAVDNQEAAKSEQFSAFSPSFAGLIYARKVCRFEMAKIVNEVDLVAKDPKLSIDATRDAYFLNPLVFEQLLPIVRSLSPDCAKRRVKDPNAAMLLGYIPPIEEADALPPVYKLENPIQEHPLRLQDSIQRVAWKAEEYLMQGCAGAYTEKGVHSQAPLVNDLESLDATFRPFKLSVWIVDQVVHGIQITYAKGEHKSHGTCNGDASHIWNLANNGSEIISEVIVRSGLQAGRPVIASIALATSNCNVFDTAIEQKKDTTAATDKSKATDTDSTEKSTPADATKKEEDSKLAKPIEPPGITKTYRWTRPEDGQWSLRGFFTFSHSGNPNAPITPCTLGIVWGKDTFVPLPTAAMSVPICKNFLELGSSLQANIRTFKTLLRYGGYADKFLMGKSVSTGVGENEKTEYFNALDSIDVHWTLRTIAFASQGGKLTGLKSIYSNGYEVTHGTFERQVWHCDLQSDLVVAKITAGNVQNSSASAYIDTVEFIRADSNGRQSVWPLNVSTIRYLGEGTQRVSKNVCEVVEQAPAMGGNSRWTIRGFFGEHSGGIITRLGVIWGRG